MIKVAAAVIKYEDKILLMRRAPDQSFAGFWEFPGGKVEQGERVTEALKRELDEELCIKAKVGKLITHVPFGRYEVFAYNVTYYDGLIKLSVHDDMEWVSLNEALKYNLLAADKKIIMYITKTKEKKEQTSNLFWAEHITRHISRPKFDNQKQAWVVIKNEGMAEEKTYVFENDEGAMDFYIAEAKKILNPFFDQPQNTHS